MSNLINELTALDVVREDRLAPFYPRVRDRDDIAVLRDTSTEVIVLSRTDHISRDYYETRKEKDTYAVRDKEVTTPRLEDNMRRTADFGAYIRNRRWLDFGCGLGGMLDELASQSEWAAGLEPARERAAVVRSRGHLVVESVQEIEDASLDVITMFHVLEHLTQPIGMLCQLRRCLKPGGMVLVEVPHARDALFTLYDCEPFKQFTFWSEHLVLHTRTSLSRVIEAAGFGDVEITGCQRYPLANHLHWLARQKPGGHDAWRFLSNVALHTEYEAALNRIDRTDTLVGIGRNIGRP